MRQQKIKILKVSKVRAGDHLDPDPCLPKSIIVHMVRRLIENHITCTYT